MSKLQSSSLKKVPEVRKRRSVSLSNTAESELSVNKSALPRISMLEQLEPAHMILLNIWFPACHQLLRLHFFIHIRNQIFN